MQYTIYTFTCYKDEGEDEDEGEEEDEDEDEDELSSIHVKITSICLVAGRTKEND